ncbi:MAG: sigma-70 family RNA polymerase sigma factor [Chloroflexota bacterium]
MFNFNRKDKPSPYAEMDDKELVELAKTDKEAFGAIYERYVTKIYNYIYYRTSNQQDAEDLTAKVFSRALSHIENYVDKGVPFQAWLYRIAHNLVANFHRDRSRRKIISLDDYIVHTLQSDAPDKKAEVSEQKDLLMEAIQRLPADRQQLIILKFIEQKSNAEIGDIMDRTEGAVKSLYHRTLLSLRDELRLQQLTLKSDQPGNREKQG